MLRTIIIPLMGGLAAWVALLLAAPVHAGGGPVQVIETSIARYGTPTTVSISTSAWTKVPSSRTLTSRTGVLVDVPAAASANMAAHVGDCSSTSVAITVRPIEIIRGEPEREYKLDGNTCLWVLSLHTAAENLHFQEVSRRHGPS